MNKKVFYIKRKISGLEFLVNNITISKIESNISKIPEYITNSLHIGKYDYKFKNTYDNKTQTHTIRFYFKFYKKLTKEEEKFIENLKINEIGKLKEEYHDHG